MGSRSWLGGSRGQQRPWLSEVGVPATPVPSSPCLWFFPSLSLFSSRWLSLLCVTLALVLASKKRTILLGPPPHSCLLCSVLLRLLYGSSSTELEEADWPTEPPTDWQIDNQTGTQHNQMKECGHEERDRCRCRCCFCCCLWPRPTPLPVAGVFWVLGSARSKMAGGGGP